MKDLNLIPKSYYQKKREKKKKLIKGVLTFIAMIIVAVAFAIPFIIKHNLNKEVVRLENIESNNGLTANSELRFQLDEIKRLYKEREKESEKINVIINGYSFSTIIDKIEASKPDKLFLINTNYAAEKFEDKTITLYGMAAQDTDVSQFIINLKKSNLFKNVVIKSLTKLDNGNCSFTINLQITGG